MKNGFCRNDAVMGSMDILMKQWLPDYKIATLRCYMTPTAAEIDIEADYTPIRCKAKPCHA